MIGEPLCVVHTIGEDVGDNLSRSDRFDRVVVAVDNGKANFPPSVLAHGRFPPLTRWQAEHPPSDFSGDPGYVRRDPSPERERLHDHRWPRN